MRMTHPLPRGRADLFQVRLPLLRQSLREAIEANEDSLFVVAAVRIHYCSGATANDEDQALFAKHKTRQR